jgi:hypothetical protein
MQSSFQLPDGGGTCVFTGDCQLTQDGGSLAGTVHLSLLSGPGACPVAMSAALEGVVEGDFVSGTLSGQLGTATFTGQRGKSFSGDVAVEEGPFSGVTGAFLAERSILAIPALGGLGLVLLVVAVLGAGALILRRRRPAGGSA